jgi:hypothetical protein
MNIQAYYLLQIMYFFEVTKLDKIPLWLRTVSNFIMSIFSNLVGSQTISSPFEEADKTLLSN